MNKAIQPHHAYHQSLVYKVHNADKPDQVHVDLDRSLDAIRRIHDLTGGLHQIAYLVGWQFDGHDSKYPDWSQPNPRLRRPRDASARDSLHWIMREARAYNAVVSVHINMNDAYENSPLWDAYVENDLLIREPNGELLKGGVWGGEQCYLVNKKREWESGFARQRIDALLELLPLEEAHTVHIDAFEPRPDPYHGNTADEEAEAMQEMLLYWASRGVDVTVEWLHFAFVGMTPMVWHLNTEEHERLTIPPDVVCGGGDAWNFRRRPWSIDLFGANWIRQPQAGCLFERAWGANAGVEVGRCDLGQPFADRFCLHTLPWHYLNRRRALKHVHTADSYEVHYSGNIVSSVTVEDETYSLREGDRVWIDDTDVCMPAAWLENTLLAYSKTGGTREWQVPADWPADGCLELREWDTPEPSRQIPLNNGCFKLELRAQQAVWLTPSQNNETTEPR